VMLIVARVIVCLGLGWLQPPWPVERAFVSYIGGGKQEYLDLAIVLGLSLRNHSPQVPRLLLYSEFVGSDVEKMTAVGWAPMGVHSLAAPPEARTVGEEDGNQLTHVFGKFHAWRLNITRAVLLDVDLLILQSGLESLLDAPLLLSYQNTTEACPWGFRAPSSHRDCAKAQAPPACAPGIGCVRASRKPYQVGMVKDCPRCLSNWNSGVIVLRPSLRAFEKLVKTAHRLGMVGDQHTFNRVFHGAVAPVPFWSNVFVDEPNIACERETEVVAVHFSGPVKPTSINSRYWKAMLTGDSVVTSEERKQYACRETSRSWYQLYFSVLLQSRSWLSPMLREALSRFLDSGVEL